MLVFIQSNKAKENYLCFIYLLFTTLSFTYVCQDKLRH